MEKEIKEAFYEVNEILNLIPKELVEKIPNSFLEIIKENKANNYYKEIKGLDNLEILKKETIVLLGLIYRDFLCTEEERQDIIRKEKKAAAEKYNYDNLFKKINYAKSNEQLKNVQSKSLIEVKNKWYVNIIDFFKKIFA